MEFINLTPHDIVLNDGRVYKTSGVIARVSNKFTEFVNDIAKVSFGEVENLPEPKEGIKYIVSQMILNASSRTDLVAPATGHPDCIRENGFIVSVPGFVVQ